MTLAEIENLLKQLQEQVKANTAAITTLNNTITNYATTDDLNAIAKQVNTLLVNNVILQESVAALDTSVKKIDNISSLIDVDINNITENDVLQFSSRGKWQNVQPMELKGVQVNSTTGASSLNGLADVQLTTALNGQFLVFDSALGYWTNKTIEIGGNVEGLDNYMTFADAKRLYLPLSGGTLTGQLIVKDNVIVHKALTMFDE